VVKFNHTGLVCHALIHLVLLKEIEEAEIVGFFAKFCKKRKNCDSWLMRKKISNMLDVSPTNIEMCW
jgi:hypothetical protein